MDIYEKRMNMLRNGDLLPPSDTYDPNADLAAHASSHKRIVRDTDTYLSKEQLQELRKVQNERNQVSTPVERKLCLLKHVASRWER